VAILPEWNDRHALLPSLVSGIKILPSWITMSQALNHRLADRIWAVRDRAIDQIVSYVTEEGYEGIDADLEMSRDRPGSIYSLHC